MTLLKCDASPGSPRRRTQRLRSSLIDPICDIYFRNEGIHADFHRAVYLIQKSGDETTPEARRKVMIAMLSCKVLHSENLFSCRVPAVFMNSCSQAKANIVTPALSNTYELTKQVNVEDMALLNSVTEERVFRQSKRPRLD
jgi:hypothetical protein